MAEELANLAFAVKSTSVSALGSHGVGIQMVVTLALEAIEDGSGVCPRKPASSEEEKYDAVGPVVGSHR